MSEANEQRVRIDGDGRVPLSYGWAIMCPNRNPRTSEFKPIKKDGNKSCVILGCNDVSGKIEWIKNGMSRDLPKIVFE
jgi:hypothetical protein